MQLIFVPKKGKPVLLGPRFSRHVKVCDGQFISLKNKTRNKAEAIRDIDGSKLQIDLCHDVSGKKKHSKLASIFGLGLFANLIGRLVEYIVFPGRETQIAYQPIRTPSRYPDFAMVDRRLQSFASWVLPRNETKLTSLAKNGFFYTGIVDCVRCYQCGIGLKDWADDDDPLVEHIRYSPSCTHIEDTIHPSKVQYYKNIAQLMPDSNSIDLRRVYPETREIYQTPQYLDYHSRISTFLRFPQNTGQTPEQLATAGFYFTGPGDRVRCFSCDGGLRNFELDDDPWIEHARWFPNCLHVQSVKGGEFVQFVQDALKSEAEDQESHDEDKCTAYDADSIYYSQLLHQLEFDETELLAAQELYSELQIPTFSTRKRNIDLEENLQEGETDRKKQKIGVTESQQLLQEMEVLFGAPMPTQLYSSAANKEDSALEEENRKLTARLKCIQCEDNNINCLFLPCGHHKMCMECSKDAMICPLCCKEIKARITTYMA